jgi:hypothetical protein
MQIKGGGLQTSNQTRMTSVYVMAASLARLKGPLAACIECEGLDIKASIKELVGDAKMWRTIKFVTTALEPFEQVQWD